jgi:hypothetical protein
MLWSQVFYSIGEIFTALVLLFNADRTRRCNTMLNNIIVGNALLHAVQMLADEKLVFNARNIAFLIGDISVFGFGTLMEGQSNSNRDWLIRCSFTFIGMITFQLFFADSHSMSIFK